MMWNVASARGKISLRKCLVVLRICPPLEGIGCKNAFCWQQCFLTHDFLHIVYNGGGR